MDFEAGKLLSKPRQRALGLSLLALIVVGSMTWFKEALSPLLNKAVFGDVDVVTILSLVGLWTLWQLKQKSI